MVNALLSVQEVWMGELDGSQLQEAVTIDDEPLIDVD